MRSASGGAVLPRPNPEPAADAPLAPSAVTARLGQIFSSPTYRPPMLPAVALQVMELSRRPGVDFDEVLTVLERDGMLAGRVLSIAQSAMYAGRSSVVSLRQALVRLGIKTLRNVVLEAALNLRVFRVPGYEPTMERLRRHSSTTAHLAALVARHGRQDPETAFVCGLLHDVGMAASLLAIVDSAKGPPPPIENLCLTLDAVDSDASGLVTGLWKLAPEVQREVERHHQLTV